MTPTDPTILAAATAAREIFRRDLIAKLQRDLHADERALRALESALLGEGHVVRSAHGLTIDFDTERVVGGAFNVVNPRPCGAATARRFSKADAERIAQATADGTGEPFHAVHVVDAIRDQIAELRRVIADLSVV